MRKMKLAFLFSILATSLAANAAAPCNGFEIKIKNNTADNLLVDKIELDGADLQPGGIQKVNSHTEQSFTVNNSKDGKEMKGELRFHSISLPTKKVTIKFNLDNKKLICEHSDKGSDGDYSVEKTRLPGHVSYDIG